MAESTILLELSSDFYTCTTVYVQRCVYTGMYANKQILKFYLFQCVAYRAVSTEDRKGHPIPWKQSYRWLLAAM